MACRLLIRSVKPSIRSYKMGISGLEENPGTTEYAFQKHITNAHRGTEEDTARENSRGQLWVKT